MSQKRTADDDLITKRAGESQSKAAQSRAVYENAQSREQTSAGQAQRLGSMSGTDHANAINAIAAMNARGYSGLSQEQKATVRGVAPDRAREEEQKAGEKLVGTYQNMLPGGEYRDKYSDAKVNANKEFDQLVGMRDAATAESFVGVAKVLKESLDNLTESILTTVAQQIAKVELAARRRNEQ